jgi:intein/homing endonuclease
MKSKLTPELSEILGAFIGDGWIESRESGFYIMGDPEEDKEYYEQIIFPIFRKYFGKGKLKEFKSWKVFGLVCYDRKIIKQLIDLGFQKGKKSKTVSVPPYIKKSKDLEIMKSVVRGIFDTDGCFSCSKAYGKYDDKWSKTHNCKPRIKFTSVSKSLWRDIQLLLDQLDIKFNLTFSKGRFVSNRNRLDTYIIHIDRRAEISKFFDVIKPNNPRHLTRYAVWKKLGYLPPRTKLKERKILLL